MPENSIHNNVEYWAVVPAAGVGSRMQSAIPKQYLEINGKKVIEYSIETLLANKKIQGVVVAIAKKDHYWQSVKIETSKPIITVEGGAERCHSVLNALMSLQVTANSHDWVLVHDAARPCLRDEDINALISGIGDGDVGGLLAAPVRDTMKRAGNENQIESTVDRIGLWHALTPQMFRLDNLIRALDHAIKQKVMITDESSAIEMSGDKPVLIEGHADNIKITCPEDLQLAAFYLNNIGLKGLGLKGLGLKEKGGT